MTQRKINSFTLAMMSSVLFWAGLNIVMAAPLVTGAPVQSFDTNSANPGWIPGYDSPDSSDVVYLGSHRNTLLICDGEVDEMGSASWAPAGFSGYNLFEVTLDGSLVQPLSTTNPSRTGWSNEPVGCAYNPVNRHLFVSDDDQRMVFEIDPGNDGQLFTGDDTRTSFSTSLFGNNDPEGLAFVYDPDNPNDATKWALFLVNGVDSEIHKIPAKVKRHKKTGGQFIGWDLNNATHFDILSQGIQDPEGIAFDTANRLLMVAGKPQTRLAHIYPTGPLVRMVDISAFNAGAGPRKPAGIAFGPGGRIFIAARGIDNNTDPDENDGKIHELSIPKLGALPPAVAAGPDMTVFLPNSVQLNGVAENVASTRWSQISGPGLVIFGNSSSPVTTASFIADGVYVLRLSDTGTPAYDDVTVQVRQPSTGFRTIYASPLLSAKIPINPDNANSLTMSVANEDIIAFDMITRTWSMVFDGSDVGLGAAGVNVNAFKRLSDGSILLSMDVPVTLQVTDPSTGAITDTLIDDSDIVRFIPASLGANTAGSFQWYFDGSDVGLDTDSEDIDAIAVLPSGKLVVSLTGSGSVPEVTSVQDEDLITFTASDLGAGTAGTWALHFDGSDVELADGGDDEDVIGAWVDSNNIVDPDSSEIYLSAKGAFSVTGASGGGDDVFKCSPSSTGTTTTCSYAFAWDGGGFGIPVGTVLDGIDLEPLF